MTLRFPLTCDTTVERLAEGFQARRPISTSTRVILRMRSAIGSWQTTAGSQSIMDLDRTDVNELFSLTFCDGSVRLSTRPLPIFPCT